MQCKECGKPAARQTVFGVRLGPLCNACFREMNQRMAKVATPALRGIRNDLSTLLEDGDMDPECKPIEYVPLCEKCGDKLTGHEDDSATRCRWCVTCIDATVVDVAESGVT